jgi:hypothetical protein
MGDDRFPGGIQLFARGQVHDRVRVIFDGHVDFVQFALDVGRGGRVAQVCVDFAIEVDPDNHGIEPVF